MTNRFEWTNPTGTKFALEISYTETLVDEILNSDGYEIDTGKKEIQIKADLVLFANGEKVDNCWNTDFWKFIDVTNEKAIAMGLTKKIWGLKVAVTEEIAEQIEKFIADYIQANKNEKVVAFENEKFEQKKAEELAYAKSIVAKAEKQRDIPTAKVARERMKNYNNVYNEGGEGFVPQIIDIDAYNRALDIIKSNS